MNTVDLIKKHIKLEQLYSGSEYDNRVRFVFDVETKTEDFDEFLRQLQEESADE